MEKTWKSFQDEIHKFIEERPESLKEMKAVLHNLLLTNSVDDAIDYFFELYFRVK